MSKILVALKNTLLISMTLSSTFLAGADIEKIVAIQQATIQNLQKKIENIEKQLADKQNEAKLANENLSKRLEKFEQHSTFNPDGSINFTFATVTAGNISSGNDIIGKHLYIDDGEKFKINSPAGTLVVGAKISTWDLDASNIYHTNLFKK